MNFGEFIPQLLNPLLVTFHNDCNTIIQNMNDICGNEMWYENKMDILVKTFDTNIRNHMVCILADRLINQISINAKNRFDKYSSRLLRHNLGFIAIQQGMLFIDAILLMVSPSSHESLFIKITPDIQLLCKSISKILLFIFVRSGVGVFCHLMKTKKYYFIFEIIEEMAFAKVPFGG